MQTVVGYQQEVGRNFLATS